MVPTGITGALHDFLSAHLLLPLLRFQRAARPGRQAVVRAFREGMRFRSAAAPWSQDQRREWMLKRLRYVVRRAHNQTPYYRDAFSRIGFDPDSEFSFDTFSRLPVLERRDIQSAGESLLDSTVSRTSLKKDATGGSTGIPTQIWKGPEEEGWSESAIEYFQRQIGAGIGSRTALLWGHHLDPVASDNLFDRFQTFAFNRRWFDCFRLSPDILARYHRELTSFQPACIIAYASGLAYLAEYLLDHNIKPTYPSHSLITGGEKLLASQRTKVQDAFGMPVHERYGSRDVGAIGFQLKPNETGNYTIDWANILLEPESDAPFSDILITKLHADGMPMIRYRIGDVAHFPQGSNPGNPTFELSEVLGRNTDRIWHPNGSYVHGNEVPHLLKSYPVREFMLVQRADYSVQLQLIPSDGFSPSARHDIQQVLLSNFPGIDVSIAIVDSIPRTKAGKWRPVVTEVNNG